MNVEDLITIVRNAGLDDATEAVVIKELSDNKVSRSSILILQGVMQKGRFGSRSEAGRYAANMRWQGQGKAGEGAMIGGGASLQSLLDQGYTITKVGGADPAIRSIAQDASVAFNAAISKSSKQNAQKRRVAWNLVKSGLLAGSPEDTHIVLKDPKGRLAGVATVTYGTDVGSKGNARVAYIQTLGTTGVTKGAGRALVEQVIADARSKGLASVQLESYDSAVGFYEKLGFQKFRLNTLGEYTREMELKI